MIYTNVTNLHPIMFNWAISREQHKKMADNEFSVTELLNDPYKIYLKRHCSNEAEVDVQSMIASCSGTDWHAEMEKQAKGLGYETEKEMSITLVTPKKRTIVLYGKCDAVRDDELDDYKETKLATFEKNAIKSDMKWFRQMMIYTMMLRSERTIKVVNIIGKLKDVSSYAAFKSGDNPYSGRMITWEFGKDFTDQDIEEAIRFILANADAYFDIVEGKQVSECSAENRLNTSVFKIYKLNKSGIEKTIKDKELTADDYSARAEKGCSNFKTEDEALEYFTSHFDRDKFVIRKVEGEDIGCYYCDMKTVCEYYKKQEELNEKIEG